MLFLVQDQRLLKRLVGIAWRPQVPNRLVGFVGRRRIVPGLQYAVINLMISMSQCSRAILVPAIGFATGRANATLMNAMKMERRRILGPDSSERTSKCIRV